uniref:Synaptobrevin,domain-containing protein n=1 Tax=Schistosoma japonicum TaxID=6182 RepID=C1LFW4_SCHJA|nr:Synaptobrevin,domain-containing protein [Schistosoma japonicum]
MDNQYNYQADDQIRQHQAKVQEVVGIMKDNVNLVLERETRLAEIDTRADELQVQSKQFQSAASRVRRKYFWQNMKMWIIIGSLGVIILVVIIVWSVSNRNS